MLKGLYYTTFLVTNQKRHQELAYSSTRKRFMIHDIAMLLANTNACVWGWLYRAVSKQDDSQDSKNADSQKPEFSGDISWKEVISDGPSGCLLTISAMILLWLAFLSCSVTVYLRYLTPRQPGPRQTACHNNIAIPQGLSVPKIPL